jgi:uncharacterized protein YacL
MSGVLTASSIAIGILIILLLILRLRHISVQSLAIGIIGTITGLLVGALLSVPLSKLPEPYGNILPIVASVCTTVILVTLVMMKRYSILRLMPWLKLEDSGVVPALSSSTSDAHKALVDTSAIIDGRIADIAEAGFAPRHLVVPRFVLAELQNIADSEDAMRRGRGRRGLEVLNRLREFDQVEVEVTDEDVSEIKEVDAKLVALAQRFNCDVLTTDYNLNRVAVIQGVRVLNVNELSNAIRPVVIPGEQLLVHVVQPGKERGQGVGYLADGTMIVVDNGDKLIGQDVITEVTRVFQTVAGKMIFAVPQGTKPSTESENESRDMPDEIAVTTPGGDQSTQKPRTSRGSRGGRGRKPHTGADQLGPKSSTSKSIEDRLVEDNNSHS